MSNITPIETVYNGYRFRSRLEARWAVFFDTLGIKYEYEPQGYTMSGLKYLPDFELTESDGTTYYCEIKPGMTEVSHSREKIQALATEFVVMVLVGYPKIPVLATDKWVVTGGAYALHFAPIEIPKTRVQKKIRNEIDQTFPGVIYSLNGTLSMLDPRSYIWQQRHKDGSFVLWPYPAWEPCADDEFPPVIGFIPLPKGDPLPVHMPLTIKSYDSPQLIRAYEAAQQARFEHGCHGGQ